ncbi:MAG: hypothetical protein AAF639_46905 [Chloroflexota bacterium]
MSNSLFDAVNPPRQSSQPTARQYQIWYLIVLAVLLVSVTAWLVSLRTQLRQNVIELDVILVKLLAKEVIGKTVDSTVTEGARAEEWASALRRQRTTQAETIGERYAILLANSDGSLLYTYNPFTANSVPEARLHDTGGIGADIVQWHQQLVDHTKRSGIPWMITRDPVGEAWLHTRAKVSPPAIENLAGSTVNKAALG